MNEKLRVLFETQITKEMESAYLYLGMSKYFSEKGLKGFATWFKKQAEEEMEHAHKFIDYLLDQDIEFDFADVKYIKVDYTDLIGPFKKQLEHEKLVTSLIFDLYNKAVEVNDLFAQQFLVWFVNEQREEEETAKELLDTMEFIGDEKVGVFELNKKLGKRE